MNSILMTDKEKIRAEIERLKQYAESSKMEWIDDGYNQNAFAETCRISSFDKLLSFIDSLPEEPAPKGYDEAYLNECIAKASNTWEGVDVDKYMDEVRGRESDDLEEAADEYAMNYVCAGPYNSIGKNGFMAGAIWQQLKMMEGAVDAEITRDIHNLLHVKSGPLPMPTKHRFGDRVKILILRNDERTPHNMD